MSYCNREKAAVAIKEVFLNKRIGKYNALKPLCKICGTKITFEEYSKGRRDLCKSKHCRSEINKLNGSKQDKSKISGQVKNSQKWKNATKVHLEKSKSRIEVAFEKIFRSLYPDLKTQVNVVLPDGSNKFIDFEVNNVFVEIDGPYHDPQFDKILDDYLESINRKIIRVNVARHWTKIFEDVGEVLKKIDKDLKEPL